MDYTQGRDWICGTELDPNGLESLSVADVAYSIVRRITTERGSLIDDPDYGIDIRDFLHLDMTPAQLNSIAAQVQYEVQLEPRVLSNAVTVSKVDYRELSIQIAFSTRDGEQALTLSVSESGITVAKLRNGRF